MWLKVIVLIGFIGCVLSLPNQPLNTKVLPKTFNEPIVTPFIDDPPLTYRLPNDSIPLQYDLQLRTDIQAGRFEFFGRLKVQIQMKTSNNEIVMHSKQHTVTNVDSYDQDLINRDAQNLLVEKIASHDFIVIKLRTMKAANEIFWLDIEYNGILREDQEGFYRGSYVNELNETVYYATTQFEITEARHAFPCFDEPAIRAPFKLAISYKEPYYAIANMPVVSTFDDEFPGYKRTLFETTPPIQTYLLAFLISDYKFKDAPENSTRIPQKIYGVPKVINEGWADYASSVVGDVVRELEKYIGYQYPFPKLDHAALTTFKHGAMENAGLITYIDNGLLLNPNEPDSSKTYRENSIVGLIAHETAHQWFGDAISPEWWSYTWLNEGFATLFTNYIPDKIYPERNIMKNFVRNNMPAAFETDELNTTWSMNHYIEDPPSLWTKFNNIGYSKSGCVLRMFQETLTENSFAKGLKYYFDENEMTAANPETLHAALQKAYDEDFLGGASLDISTLMGTWENQAGYPMVSVSLNGNNVEFSQTRYPLTNGEIYSIPLTYSTKSSKNFNIKRGMQWLTGSTLTLAGSALNFNSGDWIILNNQQVGYYRVDYSHDLWHAIIDQLIADYSQIHPINRAVLRDEIYLGWKVFDKVNAADILDSLLYFSVEDEAISWSKSNQFFSELLLRLSNTEIYDRYLQFLRDLTKPQILYLGYEGVGSEHTDITDLRNQLRNWNCRSLDGDCLLNEYQKWFVLNSTKASSYNYCFVLTLLDAAPFSEILVGITTDRNYPSRGDYLNNLGCNRDEENLKSLLAASIDSGNALNVQERMTMIRTVFTKSPLGLRTALNFIDEKYVEIAAFNGTQFLTLITQLAQNINPSSLVGFMRLRDTLSNDGYINVDDVIELNKYLTSSNEWHAKNYESIKAWFEGYTEPLTTTSTSTTTSTTERPTTTLNNQPTSTETQSPSPVTTPSPQETTTLAASSIMVSLNALILCILLSLIFARN